MQSHFLVHRSEPENPTYETTFYLEKQLNYAVRRFLPNMRGTSRGMADRRRLAISAQRTAFTEASS